MDWTLCAALTGICAAVILFEALCLFVASKIARIGGVSYSRCLLSAFLAQLVPALPYLLLARVLGEAPAAVVAVAIHLGVLALLLRARQRRQIVAYGAGFGAYAVVIGALLLPAMFRARAEARRVVDLCNLHAIGLGLRMYADHHGERTPASLVELFPDYVADRTVFVSPQDRNPLPTQGGVPCSYEYVGCVRLDYLHPGTIVCYTRKGIFPDGRNVLYVDNVAEWVPGDRLHNPRDDLQANYESAVRRSVPPSHADDSSPGEEWDFDAWQRNRERELREFYELDE